MIVEPIESEFAAPIVEARKKLGIEDQQRASVLASRPGVFARLA